MSKTPKTHIVYPYLIPRDKSVGWELMYSIRSIYKNFKGDFDITIIGEIPDWVNRDEVTCIEIDNFNIDAQRQTKINQKILKACDLYEDFIVFNDDIILMKETTKGDLMVARRTASKFNFKQRRTNKKNSFTEQCRNSYFMLKEKGFQYDVNYVSHCPHYYKTSVIKKIRKVINLAPLEFPTVVFENIYHNFNESETLPAKDFRYGCWGQNCNEYNNQQILNFDENGYNNNRWIKSLLEGTFPKKCKVEK